ncbi:hypothetical protein DEIPH_ctg025orf0028 [Deinococcus phoenicis]|uniref:Lipoprotein n=1 Tax=Deinococcus phoenicis TaxID=1476583 RepID=A0A016QPX9_9DEIO|nr:hypothetical protein [Deinococcus phoenicis]EYB68195.1 hypothetical protein DEIPH_ctg025orf0028 [Deinococcus phoenicis]
MRFSVLHRVLPAAALLTALTGCAFGAYIGANTPLERAINGTYEGIGVGGTGRVPYRLILYVQEREGRASGVITNLESHKAYAVSGQFRRAGPGGNIDVNLYEDGDKLRGTLRAEITGTKLSGVLRTVLLGKELLGYTVNLDKQVEGAAMPISPAPGTP